MPKRNLWQDNIVEIKKPRRKQAVFGYRNGATVAYVYDMGKPKGSWDKRYSVSAERSGEPVGTGSFTNNLTEAKRYAKRAVKGRGMRNYLRRIGG